MNSAQTFGSQNYRDYGQVETAIEKQKPVVEAQVQADFQADSQLQAQPLVARQNFINTKLHDVKAGSPNKVAS